MCSGLRLKLTDKDSQSWCKHSSTKSDGAEQQNNSKEMQRLRAEHASQPAKRAQEEEQLDNRHRLLGQDEEYSVQELENCLCVQATRSYVSVDDLHLGRMMGQAEMAAATTLRTYEPRHGRTAQVSARHVDNNAVC